MSLEEEERENCRERRKVGVVLGGG